MTTLIVFTHPKHGLGVSRPFVTDKYNLNDIAMTVVPEGVSFIFVDEADVPVTPAEYAAWQPDFSNPDGIGVGAEEMHRRKASAV